MTLNEYAGEIEQNARNKGFYEEEVHPAVRIALIHAELSEALEELRKGYPVRYIYFDGKKPEGVTIELVDALIRILDMLKHEGVDDIDAAVRLKMDYNATRSHKHGGKSF